MAMPERKTTSAPAPLPWSATDAHYQPGAHSEQLRADLAHRLAQEQLRQQGLGLEPGDRAPAERLIRLVSVAGGYLALLAGYAGLALLVWY